MLIDWDAIHALRASSDNHSQAEPSHNENTLVPVRERILHFESTDFDEDLDDILDDDENEVFSRCMSSKGSVRNRVRNRSE